MKTNTITIPYPVEKSKNASSENAQDVLFWEKTYTYIKCSFVSTASFQVNGKIAMQKKYLEMSARGLPHTK
jgi:hypothetical protein